MLYQIYHIIVYYISYIYLYIVYILNIILYYIIYMAPGAWHRSLAYSMLIWATRAML
jgi:hypothetical protein